MLGIIAVAALLVGAGLLIDSVFLGIVGGMVAMAFGVYWITVGASFIYIIEGMVCCAIGVYMLLAAAIGLLKR